MWYNYARHKNAYMNEFHPLVTAENKVKLFTEWTRFWNMSRNILVEKSPRHMMSTRFLQAMFTPGRSKFMIVLRHPLGPMHHIFEFADRNILANDCGSVMLENWLHAHETLANDISHLQNSVVVMYEHFMGDGTQEIMDALQTALGITPGIVVPKTGGFDKSTYEIFEFSRGRLGQLPKADNTNHRRELHGDRTNITVIAESEFLFIDAFAAYRSSHPECEAMLIKYEPRVNVFGYSLYTPRRFWKSPPFAQTYVRGFDDKFPADGPGV